MSSTQKKNKKTKKKPLVSLVRTEVLVKDTTLFLRRIILPWPRQKFVGQHENQQLPSGAEIDCSSHSTLGSTEIPFLHIPSFSGGMKCGVIQFSDKIATIVGLWTLL
jgi:hypothetical protein